MNQSVDIASVRQYNTTLKQYRDAASKLQTEKDFLTKEIQNLCGELSAELGETVTIENLAQVRDSLCAKIEASLTSGNAVLSKIAGEVNAAQSVPQASVQANAAPLSQPTPVAPVVPTAPVAPVAPVAPAAPVVPTPNQPIFSAGFLQEQNTASGDTLPPLFGVR